jgi:hypothetical protein
MIFRPAYRFIDPVRPVIIIAAPAIMPMIAAAIMTAAIMIASTMVLPIPAMAAVAPIAAVMVVHGMAISATIKDIITVSRIPIILIPAAAKTDIVKAIAAVAGIIAVERRVGVAVIIAIIVAVGVDTNIIVTTGQSNGCCG